MNAEKAIRVLEQGYYRFDSVEQGKSNEFKIAVPAGCKGLRVMIAWNDPAYGAQSQWGSKVLVNDLDLSLQGAGKSYQPWVCNPTKGHVADNASRGVDTLNNIEQVTLSADELMGVGEVAVTVQGTAIAHGVQGYTLTWWFDEDVLRQTIDNDGHGLYQCVEVPSGEHSFTLDEKIPLGAATPWLIEASIEGDDTDASDNKLTTHAIYDRYPIPTSTPWRPVQLTGVEANNVKIELSTIPNGAIRYHLGKPISLYKGDGATEFVVKSNGIVPQGYSLMVWVDWDDDALFKKEEGTLVAMPSGRNPEVKLHLDASQSAGVGKRRMRLAIAPTAELADGEFIDGGFTISGGDI